MNTAPPTIDTDLAMGTLEERVAKYYDHMDTILDGPTDQNRHMAWFRLLSLDADPADKVAINQEVQLLGAAFDVRVHVLRYPTDFSNTGEGVLVAVGGELPRLATFLQHVYHIPSPPNRE